MEFKFSKKYYQISLLIVWLGFLSRAIYLGTTVDRSLIFIELFLSAVITHLSLGSFLYTLYKYKMVRFINVTKIVGFIYLNLHYLIIADNIESTENSIFSTYNINPNYILPSLLSIILGMLALDFADFLFRAKLSKVNLIKNRIGFSTHGVLKLKRKNGFIVFSFIYLFISILMIATGLAGYTDSVLVEDNPLLGSYSAILQLFQYFSPLIILTYLSVVFLNKNEDKRLNNYFKLFLIVYLLSSLYAGSKGPAIILAIQLFLFYMAAGNKFPRTIVVIVIPILLLVFPIITTFREDIRSGTNKDRLESFVNSVKSIFTEKTPNNVNKSSAFASRISMFTFFVYAVEHEERWNFYKHLDRYPFLPVSFIPRQLVPNKPINDIGGRFNYMVLNLNGSSITPTSFGWAFFEGGQLFVFASFFILGCFLSYVQYLLPSRTPFYFLYYFTTLFRVISVENDIYFMISIQITMFLICWIFVKIFFEKNISDDKNKFLRTEIK